MPQIPAARSTLAVLRYLAARNGPVRAATLARDLAMPRSSAYQLIAVMMDEGFLVHYPEDRTYGLSSFVAEIGTSALRGERLGMLARPLLERLVAEVAASDSVPTVAHLAVLGGADVIYAARVQGFRAPTTVSSVGVRLPAHLTATGRAHARRPARGAGAGDLPDPRPADPPQRRRPGDPRRSRPAARRDARPRLRDRGRRRDRRVRVGRARRRPIGTTTRWPRSA